MDLAWSKANLIKEASAELLKKKVRSVSRDLCYVTDNYESSVCWVLSCLKGMPACFCVQFEGLTFAYVHVW